MANIVLGLGSSHAPQLRLAPDQWYRRVNADHANPELWYRGKTYTFPELVEERGPQTFLKELGEEKAQARFQACQQAIARLAATLDEVAPDVVVILGDDQHECFRDDNMPALSIYWGETVDDAPDASERQLMMGSAGGVFDNAPKERASHPTDAVLGRYLIETLIEDGYDVAHTNSLPAQNHKGAIGHAFHYVYRRLMNNEVIPHVPIFMNTYYPPNQPTIKRCFQFGRSLRKAIETWESDKRVALIASGGLSHFVIEEDLDEHIIDALKTKNEAKLTELPNIRFNSGTSEIRNWIILAGAVDDDGLNMNLIDYVPCYRSEAGTGCAMGFAEWR
jgi:hypothetical protein